MSRPAAARTENFHCIRVPDCTRDHDSIPCGRVYVQQRAVGTLVGAFLLAEPVMLLADRYVRPLRALGFIHIAPRERHWQIARDALAREHLIDADVPPLEFQRTGRHV